MKKILVIIIFVFMIHACILADLILVPSVGIGNGHGGIGIKTLLGYDDDPETGVIVGLGTNGGMFAYSIGFQVSANKSYFNANYGNVGMHRTSTGGIETSSNIINGLFFELGHIWYFGKSKNLFVDIGIGYSKSEEFKWGEDEHYSFDAIAWDLGLGIKF